MVKGNLFLCCLLLSLSWIVQGKSVENQEEKTNQINEEIEAGVTTAVSTEVGTEEVSGADKTVTTVGNAETTVTEPATTAAATTEATTTAISETTEPGTTVEPATREPEQCNPDSYCLGEVLPMKTVINNTFIMCDQDIQPKDRCCLPNGPHLVCYNIMVDAQHLNYDVSDAQISTDIHALCKAIVESRNLVQGQYTSASIEAGKGTMVFTYSKWKTLSKVNNENPHHIKDLACEIVKK